MVNCGVGKNDGENESERMTSHFFITERVLQNDDMFRGILVYYDFRFNSNKCGSASEPNLKNWNRADLDKIIFAITA